MKQFSLSKEYIKTVLLLFALLILAKAISLVVLLFLPQIGVEEHTSKNYAPKYHRIDFRNMLENGVKKANKNKVQVAGTSTRITNMLLKGLYGTANEGFVIIALKSAPEKTSIISVGETYQGFKLTQILQDAAIFQKNGHDYILKIKSIEQKELQKRVKTYREEQIQQVAKKDISYYKRDPNRIWNDISINEIRDGKEIVGFKIFKIKKGSKMAQLGLQKGDVIIMVNNRRLKSYKDAFDAYEEAKNLSEVRIVVLRNNREREFIYEVN